MTNFDLTKVADLKPFIQDEDSNVTLKITEAKEIPNNGFKYTFENAQGEILFKKFYFSKEGLPFFKEFIQDIGLEIADIKSPLQILGKAIQATTKKKQHRNHTTIEIVDARPYQPIPQAQPNTNGQTPPVQNAQNAQPQPTVQNVQTEQIPL